MDVKPPSHAPGEGTYLKFAGKPRAGPKREKKICQTQEIGQDTPPCQRLQAARAQARSVNPMSHEVKKPQGINDRIRKGQAVVVTARRRPTSCAAWARSGRPEVDVVTTGTFSPMARRAAFQLRPGPAGHAGPKVRLNSVQGHAGWPPWTPTWLHRTPRDDPLNKVHPGRFKYGGGHVIETCCGQGRAAVVRVLRTDAIRASPGKGHHPAQLKTAVLFKSAQLLPELQVAGT
jgi:hypothetical protein